jgi:hypothetical protein
MARAKDWSRVSTPAGHFSVPSAYLERAGSKWRVLAQDAIDHRGRPIAPKLREDVAEPSPARKTAAKKTAAKRTASDKAPDTRVDSDPATPTEEKS